MFDKILLILLILLLPLGILASRFITGEVNIGSNLSAEKEIRDDPVVNQVSQQTAPPSIKSGEIQVTAMIYASESASLTISGSAPQTQAFLWIWTASSKSKSDEVELGTRSASKPIWRGPEVIWPREGGSFNTIIDVAQMAGMVEIRLEQNGVVTNVRYDLDNQKPLQ